MGAAASLDEARSDGEVGRAVHDWLEESGDVVGVVLSVAVEDHQSVDVHLAGVLEQRLERTTIASVDAVSDDGRAAGLGDSGARI